MNDLPKISIIITLYNYENFVCDTIETCLRQDYKGPVEIIVVDDFSNDNSLVTIYRNFKNTIRVIELPQNMGYSVAKNEGIKHSSGEFITTIDADDMLTLDSLRLRYEVFEQYPEALVVHGKAWVIKGDGGYEYWIKRLRKISCEKRSAKIHAQTVMVRRSVYTHYGMYDERLRSRADNEMWWRLQNVAQIGNRFGFVDQPVAFYRKHGLSMIEYRKRNPTYNEEMSRILEEQKEMRLREGITRENTRFLKR